MEYTVGGLTLLGVLIILFIYIIFSFFNEEQKRTNFLKKIKVGDTFTITICEEDPFVEDFIYKIQIIDLKEQWVKYKKIFNDGDEVINTCDYNTFFYEISQYNNN